MTAIKERFAEVVRNAELKSIAAIKFSSEVKNRSEFERADIVVDLRDRTRWTIESGRDSTNAEVDFELKITSRGEDRDTFLFSAGITYEVKYDFPTPLPEDKVTSEALKLFMGNNPRYNAWPFLREYLNYATAYASLPPLTLPLLKPFAYEEKKQNRIERSLNTSV